MKNMIDKEDPDGNTISAAPPVSATLRPRFYFLVIRSETSSIHPLPESGEVVAGRAPDADLRILDQSASRQHARFVIDRGVVRARDLGSRNRTWVNGEAVAEGAERALQSGDVITIGSLTLVLHRSSPERVVEAPSAASTPTLISLGNNVSLLADPAMIRLYELLRRLARSALPILITGETGTGKENAALAVHHFSSRSSGPMVSINCAAIPENLFESELFGHLRGSFSGATSDKPGRLETASGGTVFLDEVGELPLPAQAKLLRALETGMVMPVGGVRERTIDCRLVAATNRDLEAEGRAGRFREDLYFRLAAATVTLPPLRERQVEISLLAQRFLEDACRKLGRSSLKLADTTRTLLLRHPFPGNVRELRNLIDYCAATVTEDQIHPFHLPPRFAPPRVIEKEKPSTAAPLNSEAASFRPIADEVQELEKRRMREALEATGGNQKRAAQLIGMPLRTFVSKLKQYGLRDG
jgi:two-component system response regulator AtoC